jgi:polyphenol oxidase
MNVELPLGVCRSAGVVPLPFPFEAWLTLSTAGDMRVESNRTRMLSSLGIRSDRLLRVKQIHSRIVLAAEELLSSRSDAEGDGIVSGPDGPFLAVGVGDCMPILLADTRSGAYGILHSGWRGTGILEVGLRVMHERYGTAAADVVAFFGPCISAESYEVDEERAAGYREWGEDAVVRSGDRSYLDMRAANLGIARRLGVGLVSVADHCTFTTPELGSYRREGSQRYTGMLAIVGPGAPAGRGTNGRVHNRVD